MSLYYSRTGRCLCDGGLWIREMYISGKEYHVLFPDDPDGASSAGDVGAELYYAGPAGSAGNGRRLDFSGDFCPAGNLSYHTEFSGDSRRRGGRCETGRMRLMANSGTGGCPGCQRGGGIVCAGLLTFLDAWNMVEQPIAYLRDFTRYPISVALAYVTPSESARQFVCCILVILPPLFLFSCFHREMVEGIVFGEEK